MPEAVKRRPAFRNIHVLQIAKYRLPLPGWVSILHRVSGLLIFLWLPFLLYLLDNSLSSPDTFLYLQTLTEHIVVKLIILTLIWAYLHHFCAGIRHLFLDVHCGLDKHRSKQSAFVVFAISLPLTGWVALKLFGVL